VFIQTLPVVWLLIVANKHPVSCSGVVPTPNTPSLSDLPGPLEVLKCHLIYLVVSVHSNASPHPTLHRSQYNVKSHQKPCLTSHPVTVFFFCVCVATAVQQFFVPFNFDLCGFHTILFHVTVWLQPCIVDQGRACVRAFACARVRLRARARMLVCLHAWVRACAVAAEYTNQSPVSKSGHLVWADCGMVFPGPLLITAPSTSSSEGALPPVHQKKYYAVGGGYLPASL